MGCFVWLALAWARLAMEKNFHTKTVVLKGISGIDAQLSSLIMKA
jgi:hypothetical protein